MENNFDINKLRKEWVDLSGPWIREAREGRNVTRAGLLDEPILKACGDIKNLKILDSGCGEGRFCRILADLGTEYVLGIDACVPMIEAAKKIEKVNTGYRVADAQNLDFLDDESFDIAVSYLNQCDLPDFERNNKEIFRVLKKGGLFIVANLHPMRSAVGMWKRDENGNKEHIILDNYFDEGTRSWKMMGVEFTNFHRTLSTYMNSFIRSGFTIKEITEPTVTPENLEKYPDLDDELRVPNFIIYVLKKVIFFP